MRLWGDNFYMEQLSHGQMALNRLRPGRHPQADIPVTDSPATDTPAARAVWLWLLAVAALVLVMVLVGGATRLTKWGCRSWSGSRWPE